MDIDKLHPYVTLVKDVAAGLSAVVVAIVAILGLQTWKKQLAGKTKYELAQRLLRAIYKVREAFAHVSDPRVAIADAQSQGATCGA